MPTEMLEKVQRDAAEREAIAQVSAFYQKWNGRLGWLKELLSDADSLKHSVITLLNARDMLERLNKQAAIERERVENEAKVRLSAMDKGHRALVEDLNKKQMAADNAMAEAEKMKEAAAAARHEGELLRVAYEKKMAELAAVTPSKAKK